MIGSHNSMSYLPPKNLWGKITRLWNKCQDKTIEEQFNSGVDYFDIRINFYNDEEWHFVHNKVDYGVVNDNIWKYIGKNKIPIRVIYDRRSKPKDASFERQRFIAYLSYLQQEYNICIDSAITYWNWIEHYKPFIEVKEFHASVSAKWYQYLLGCKWFALTYSGISKYPDVEECMNEVLLLDYV
nr:MAG: phosphoinositide phospholipase C, Ca2+-dependent [Bacteriophage sp.]